VIARRHHRRTRAQQIDRDPRRDPAPTGGILAIHNDKIDAAFLFQDRKLFDHRFPTGLADDISQE
jgi:hypothetical protein